MTAQRHEFREAILTARSYISIRHFGTYNLVNTTWARLTQFAFDRGISGPSTIAFGFCYDSPVQTPPDHIRYDACLAISSALYKDLSEQMNDPADVDLVGIRLQSMPQGRTVMTTHRGPYDTLREAYTDALHAAAIGEPSFDATSLPTTEVYRNNPLLTKAESLVTEVHFLSRKV